MKSQTIAKLKGEPQAGKTELQIVDTPKGYRPRHERRGGQRIFEAFYTTKGTSGLGLWISRGIIEKHHGHLKVKSSDDAPRTGLAFSLFLPRNRPELK